MEFVIKYCVRYIGSDVIVDEAVDLTEEYKNYFVKANELVVELEKTYTGQFESYQNEKLEALNWYYFMNSSNNN